MKFCKPTFLAAVLMVAVTASHAQREMGMYGKTDTECGQYLEDRRRDRFTDHHVLYVWGFVTAYNAYSPYPGVKDDLPSATIHAYLEKFCRDNPLLTTANGAFALVREKTGAVILPRR